METVNNCYCVDFNYDLVDRANTRTVRGSATGILLYFHKSKIHKGIKEMIINNINQYWAVAQWGSINLDYQEIYIGVHVVNVIEFPLSEAQEWIDNAEKGIFMQAMNY